MGLLWPVFVVTNYSENGRNRLAFPFLPDLDTTTKVQITQEVGQLRCPTSLSLL